MNNENTIYDNPNCNTRNEDTQFDSKTVNNENTCYDDAKDQSTLFDDNKQTEHSTTKVQPKKMSMGKRVAIAFGSSAALGLGAGVLMSATPAENVIDDVKPEDPAYTATATAEVRDDIMDILNLRDPFVLTTGFDRENLYYAVKRPRDKYRELLSPTPLETEGFTLVETREVRDIIHLSCNEDILSLFRMTPYYYKTGAKDQQKAEQAQELSVKLAFGLAIYQKD